MCSSGDYICRAIFFMFVRDKLKFFKLWSDLGMSIDNKYEVFGVSSWVESDIICRNKKEWKVDFREKVLSYVLNFLELRG